MLKGIFEMIIGKPEIITMPPQRVQMKQTNPRSLFSALQNGMGERFDSITCFLPDGKELVGLEIEKVDFNNRFIGWLSNESTAWVVIEPTTVLTVVTVSKKVQ